VAKADDIHITVKLGGKPLGEFVEQREVIACDDDESPQASAVDSGADVSAGTETLEDGLRRALREVLEREESLRDQLSDAQDHIGGLQQDVSDLLARKIANLYRTLWRAVDGEPPSWSSKAERLALAAEAPSEARRAGAVVRWPKWLKTRIEEVEQLRRAHAALALRDGRVRWGARRMRLLDQELENLKRIATETVLDERRYNGHDHSDT
jgi:hypothetical protein